MTVLADIVSRIEGFQQEFKNMNKKKARSHCFHSLMYAHKSKPRGWLFAEDIFEYQSVFVYAMIAIYIDFRIQSKYHNHIKLRILLL